MTPEQYDLSVSKRFMKNGVEPELIFPTLGLCGEAGEVYTALRMGCTDEELMKELGDVAWYVAACAKKLGSSYAEASAEASLGFSCRVKSVQEDEEEAAALMAEACAFADMVKKAAWHGVEINKQAALNELVRVLRGVYTLAHSNYMTMEKVLQANHDKLEKRYPAGFVEGGGVR